MDQGIREDEHTVKPDRHLHITLSPQLLSFTLSLLIAFITLIIWLSAKPSIAEVDQKLRDSRTDIERTMELKLRPIDQKLDRVDRNLTEFINEYRNHPR